VPWQSRLSMGSGDHHNLGQSHAGLFGGRPDHHRVLRLEKSLASGVPMAKVLFAAPQVGMMLLPLMLFHQIQLMVCAVLAQRYGKRLD